MKNGGEKGDRTLDLRLMSPALYQLSYLANKGERVYDTKNASPMSTGYPLLEVPHFSSLARRCDGLRGYEPIFGKESRLSSSIFGIMPKC